MQKSDFRTSYSVKNNRRAPYLILPEKDKKCWSAREMLAKLPAVLRAAVANRYGATTQAVFENCLLKLPPEAMSAAAVGRSLGISKQATHDALQNIINMFRGIIENGNYYRCRFRIRPRFLIPLRRLSRNVNRKAGAIIDSKAWSRLVRRHWGVTPRYLGNMERLVIALVGLRQVQFSSKGTLRPLLVRSDRKIVTMLPRVASFIEKTLTSLHPNGADILELTRLAQERFPATKITESDIDTLSASLRTTEKRDDVYRAKPRVKQKRADFYESILRKAGRPLHYSVLATAARERGYRGSTYPGYVRSILGPDRRFAAVARSGYWGLTEWVHLEVRTSIRLHSTNLQTLAGPLPEKEISERVRNRRPVKRDSVR